MREISNAEHEPTPQDEGVLMVRRESPNVPEISEASNLVRPAEGPKLEPSRELRLRYPEDYCEPLSRPAPIAPFADPRETVTTINPEFRTDRACRVNCADAARCFENTWRGRREEAGGRLGTGEYTDRTEEWAGRSFTKHQDAVLVQQRLTEGGHGSSAIVHSTRIDQDGVARGHAYNVVNYRGDLLVVDAQTAEVFDEMGSEIRPGISYGAAHRVLYFDSKGEEL